MYMLFLALSASTWCQRASVFEKNWHFAKKRQNRPKTPILPQLQNFFRKFKCAHHPRTRCHLCAKFDVLKLSQS